MIYLQRAVGGTEQSRQHCLLYPMKGQARADEAQGRLLLVSPATPYVKQPYGKLTMSAIPVSHHTASPQEPNEQDIEAQYRTAVSQGVLPDTPLAREVYGYWKLFPDAILLMRVGKFYEVRSLYTGC